MNTSTHTLHDAENNCPFCFDTLKRPVSINCGHVFCGECMRTYIQKEKKNFMDCPICRRCFSTRGIYTNATLSRLLTPSEEIKNEDFGLQNKEDDYDQDPVFMAKTYGIMITLLAQSYYIMWFIVGVVIIFRPNLCVLLPIFYSIKNSPFSFRSAVAFILVWTLTESWMEDFVILVYTMIQITEAIMTNLKERKRNLERLFLRDPIRT